MLSLIKRALWGATRQVLGVVERWWYPKHHLDLGSEAGATITMYGEEPPLKDGDRGYLVVRGMGDTFDALDGIPVEVHDEGEGTYRLVPVDDLPEPPQTTRDELLAERGEVEWTDDQGRKWKRFADGQVGEDISDLDTSDVDELRRVYGRAGVIPDDKLVDWAREAGADKTRKAEIDERLAEIEKENPPEPVNDGYFPVSGPSAGTSPKTGIVMPPAIDNATTKEWADLVLEKAYGTTRAQVGNAGYSMRRLNEMRRRAEARIASPDEVLVLRSRGLI